MFDWLLRFVWNLFASRAEKEAAKPDDAMRQALLQTSVENSPVVWLLGKTGAGKTSIIAALTGDSAAEVGGGFAPCTKTAKVYRWPNLPDRPAALRFLDTRGLGEADYDPTDDIAYAEGRSHLLIAVVSIADPSHEQVLKTLREVRARDPEWPLIVAQSHLHRGYPAGQCHHPSQYPYAGDDRDFTNPEIPPDVRAALKAQRNLFAGLPGPAARFVPIDLTLPEDGFDPPNFGADALRLAVRDAGAEAHYRILRDAWEAGQSETERHAATIVWAAAGVAAASGAVPMPLAGIAGLSGVIGTMLWQLGKAYKVQMTATRWGEFFGMLGAGVLGGFAARYGLREFLKLVPPIGTIPAIAMNAAAASALTLGIGAAAREYLRRLAAGQAIDPDAIRDAFGKAFDATPPRRGPGGASEAPART